MKILLINPTYYSSIPIGYAYREPLGLAYIAAAIIQDGNHEVDVLDSVGLSQDVTADSENRKYRTGLDEIEILNILKQKQFDIIGITITKMSSTGNTQNKFFANIKKAFPNVPIVVGGTEVTLEWDLYIKDENIDYIVLGEGEKTIVELLNALHGNGDIHQVHGIVYRNQYGKVIRTQSQEPLDVDKIPSPARHLLPMENYLRFRPGKYYLRMPAATILTSRACPYDCAFCDLKVIWGRKWRGRSPISVVNEIQYLISEYKVREVLILDSNFLGDPKRAEEICDEIIQKKLDISLQIPSGIPIWLLSKNLVNKLQRSGLYILHTPIESGSSKTLHYINKNVDFDHAREIIHYANQIGLLTQTNIIVGFYFETKEDIKESIRVAESLHIDNIRYSPLRVLRHTKVYYDYLQEGLIQDGVHITNPVNTHYLTAGEIINLKNKATRNYYIRRILQLANPNTFYKEMLPKINSIERLKFIFRRVFM